MAQGIRVRDDDYEAKCDYCLEWWPLGPEWWNEHNGFRRCKACHREKRADYMAQRRSDPEVRERDRIATEENRQAKKRVDPEHTKRVQHEWYVRNAEQQRANRRARYAAQKALRGETVKPYGPTLELIEQAQERATRRRKTNWQKAERAAKKAAEARAA